MFKVRILYEKPTGIVEGTWRICYVTDPQGIVDWLQGFLDDPQPGERIEIDLIDDNKEMT
jgi:hypothetical protein